MLRVNHAANLSAARDSIWRRVGTFCRNDWRVSAYSLLLFAFFLILFSNLSRGDDLTGLPYDDPKDLLPAPPQAITSQTASSLGLFAPMPAWAHGVTMPALPAELKPMGGKTAVAGPPPPPPPLAPPKEPVTVVTTTASSAPTPATTKNISSVTNASGVTDNNPAMVTVSPFLQWIKTNPQAAAAQARQQAASYHPPSPTDAGPSTGAGAIGHGAPGGSEDPYWLPPLIDSADFGPTPVSGSAAIYSTPQR